MLQSCNHDSNDLVGIISLISVNLFALVLFYSGLLNQIVSKDIQMYSAIGNLYFPVSN